MKGKSLVIGALVAVVGTVAGCTLTIAFDPRGIDVSLEGEWTINGAIPTPADCDAAGIARVQLVFYDGGVPYRYSEFNFACSEGFFDTRPFGAIDNGRFQTQWLALDAGGAQIGSGDILLLDVQDFSIEHAILAPVDFVATGTPPLLNEMTVDIAWGPSDVDCVTAGAANIFWALNDANTGTEIIADPVGTCAGIGDRLIFSDLLPGTYELFVDAESTDRLTKWQGTCGGLTHDGGTISYNCFYDIMP